MKHSSFDPTRLRERLASSTGYEWSLRSSLSQAKAVGGLGSSADAHLAKAIQCLLVGFEEPAERLLKQATEWVQIAISADERPQRYFPGATEAARFQTLALCNWFRFNRHDAESLRHFGEHEDRYLNSMPRKDKVGVSLILLTYVNSGAFERTLEIYNSTAGLSMPTSMSPGSEAEMASILCEYSLALKYSRDEVQVTTTKFLTKNMNGWLSNGHWVRAAEWMKVVHWNNTDQTLSAKQVLRKSFDYLTDCCPS